MIEACESDLADLLFAVHRELPMLLSLEKNDMRWEMPHHHLLLLARLQLVPILDGTGPPMPSTLSWPCEYYPASSVACFSLACPVQWGEYSYRREQLWAGLHRVVLILILEAVEAQWEARSAVF